jgi:hypothetical protein
VALIHLCSVKLRRAFFPLTCIHAQQQNLLCRTFVSITLW